MKRKIVTTMLIASLLVVGGLFLTSNDNQVQAASVSAAAVSGPVGPGWSYGVDAESLATALGISVDDLSAAKSAAVLKAIDQALELELITQDQADSLKATEDVGRTELYQLIGADGAAQIDFQALLAEELGISVDEYTAAVASAKQAELDAAVTDGSITREEADAIAGRRALESSSTFVETIKLAYQSAIEKALEEGTITQAQADALLAQLENLSTWQLMGSLGGGMSRGGHGSHGGGMWGNGLELTPDSSQETEDTGSSSSNESLTG